MRRVFPVLVAALAFFVNGCGGDDADSSAPASRGGGSASWQPSPEQGREEGILTQIADQTRQAEGTPAGEEDLAQRWRGTFDGDNRMLDAVSSGGAGTVSAGGSWSSTPKQKVPLSPARKSSLRTNEPPAPQSGRSVPLPPGAAEKGAGPTLLAFDAFQKKVYDAAAPILSRLGWGAKARKGHDVPMQAFRVTVHHTQGKQTMDEASTIDAVRGIQWYHMYGRGKEGKENFEDIGYHFLIDGQGRIIEGRHPEVLGAHAEGANNGNIGVALMGDFNKVRPTEAQIGSLKRLVAFLALKYRKDPKQKGFLEGHRHFDQTDCPGKNLFAMLGRLREEIDQETDIAADKLTNKSASFADFKPMAVTRPSA